MESRLAGDWTTHAGELSRRLTKLGAEALEIVLERGDYRAAQLDPTSGHHYERPDNSPKVKSVARGTVAPKTARSVSLARVLMTNMVDTVPEGSLELPPDPIVQSSQRVLRPKYKTPFGYVYRTAKAVPKFNSKV